MSFLGTGAAAGVAQTALQAQQVAQQRDKRNAQKTADADHMDDLLELHFRALEEGDEDQNISKLRIDEQLPDRPTGELEQMPQKPGKPDDAEPLISDPTCPAPPHATPPGRDSTLYRHLDVQA